VRIPLIGFIGLMILAGIIFAELSTWWLLIAIPQLFAGILEERK
tara:strand:+ start:427 stop:558 length:132 start_codon:yes stop_codon:yes gene_type:complete